MKTVGLTFKDVKKVEKDVEETKKDVEETKTTKTAKASVKKTTEIEPDGDE